LHDLALAGESAADAGLGAALDLDVIRGLGVARSFGDSTITVTPSLIAVILSM
jgi:hypothetical protein